MTVYFTVRQTITPEMRDWAANEAATRAAEMASVLTLDDLQQFKRRRGLRRRNSGYTRDVVRRLMQELETGE